MSGQDPDNVDGNASDGNDNDSLEGAFSGNLLERNQKNMAYMMELMINENKRRDEMMMKLVEQMTRITDSVTSSASGNRSQPPSSPATETQSYHIMPDLTKNIRTFNGEGDSSSAVDWLNNICGMQTLHAWPDAFALETARTHLNKGARHWYTTKREELTTWANFQAAFRKTFGGEMSTTMRWQRMTNRQQQKNESLTSYFFEKVRLCRDVDLNFTDLKEQVLTGLNSRELCAMVVGSRHDDADALLHDLIRTERIIRARSDRFRNPKERTKTPGTTEVAVEKQSYKPKSAPNQNERSPLWNKEGEPKCLNCRKYGHIASGCTEPRELICYTCKQKGHISRNCKTKSTANANVKTEMNMISENTNDDYEKFLKIATINDHQEATAFIDQGSGVCTIKKKSATKLRLVCEPTNQLLYGFGENSVLCEAVVNVTLKIDNIRVNNVKLYVVPDDVQKTDLIIGRSFTELPDIAYLRLENKLIFGYRDEDPFKDLKIEPSKSRVILKATKEQMIEPHCVNFVSVKGDDQDMWVPVRNDSSMQQVIRKGQTVGKSCLQTKNERETARMEITRDMINVDQDTSDEQIDQLHETILKYRDCFALNMQELGCTQVTKMNIEDSNEPVTTKPYRATTADRKTMAEIIQEWRKHGIVTDTESAYASPVMIVRKKTGEPRLVVDYRKLNAQTKKKNYPIPRMEDQFEQLAGSTLFTTLDLAHGYLQVPLTDSAKEKTAFITPNEVGQFERMMFGLTNAPYEFSNLMKLVLGPLRNRVAMCYLDDLLIPAKDWADMLSKLAQVLEALRNANLTLKLRKCVFGRKQVEYLGFQLSAEGIKPGLAKIEAIESFPPPKNIHELKRFLGLTGFFRKFVRSYAEIARPLSDLTKQQAKYEWKAEQDDAFKHLKQKLTSDPVLKLYDPEKHTELHTDASASGLAGMLLQKGTEGSMHLVYCVSKKTTEEESRYHSSKLELMAIVWSEDRLRNFLLDIKFTIVTDCQALVYLNTQKTVNPQIARWSHLLQKYNFTIQHRSGDKMAHIDALSRTPIEKSEDTMEEIYDRRFDMLAVISEEDQVQMIQKSDKKLNKIIKLMEEGKDLNKEEKKTIENFKLQEGKLYRKINEKGQDKLLYVMPESMRKSLAVKFHDMMRHFSLERTIDHIRRKYWFPGMRRYIRQHIKSCFECLLTKQPAGRQPGQLHPIPPGSRPFEKVHLDHLGLFIRSTKNNVYLMILIDNLTRFVKLYPMTSCTTILVLKALKSFVIEFGLPTRIITDRGTCFTSDQFQRYCRDKGVHHTLNSSRHPRANGMIERVNRTIVPGIITKMTDEQGWEVNLKEIERDLNNAVNQTTGKTPFESLYGYVPSFVDGTLRLQADPETQRWTPPTLLQEEIRANIAKEQSKYKTNHDKRRYTGVKYDVGDVVVLKGNPVSTGDPTKTQLKYKGPFVIIAVMPSDTYRIGHLSPQQHRRYNSTAHVSMLKLYKNHEELDEPTDTSSE